MPRKQTLFFDRKVYIYIYICYNAHNFNTRAVEPKIIFGERKSILDGFNDISVDKNAEMHF